jgi:hypothetical protein
MTRFTVRRSIRRYWWLGLVFAAIGTIALLTLPNASATTQPGNTHSSSKLKTDSASAPPIVTVPVSPTASRPPAPPPSTAAPGLDAAQVAAMKAITSTWRDIVNHAPKHSLLTTQQKTVPAVAFVSHVTCTWKYDKMPVVIGQTIRYCASTGTIQVVTEQFDALAQNDPDAQIRGIGAAFIQNAAAHLGPGQKTYANGSARKINDVLGALQYIVTTALEKTGMTEESTYVVIQVGDPPDSGTIQGYFNLDNDQGPWA